MHFGELKIKWGRGETKEMSSRSAPRLLAIRVGQPTCPREVGVTCTLTVTSYSLSPTIIPLIHRFYYLGHLSKG